LLVGKKIHAAATWLGLTALFVELVVYAPIAVVERASLDKGLDLWADALMFCEPYCCSRAPCRAQCSES